MALSENFSNKVSVLEGSLKSLTTQFELMLKDGKSLAEITKKLGGEFAKLDSEFVKAQRSLKSGLTGAVKEKDVEEVEVYTKKINSLRSSHNDLQRAVKSVKDANLEQQRIANKSVQGQTVDIAKYNEAQRNSTAAVKDLLNLIKQRFAEEGRLIKFNTEQAKKARKADQDLKLAQIKNSGKSLEEQKKQSINYLNGQLRRLTKHGLKDTEEYKKIQIRREKLTKEYNDKISAENRKLEGKSFKEGFFAQFTPEKIGATLGGLTKLLGGYRIYRAAVGAISKVTVDSAKKAIEFQQSLANLGAVAGKSAEDVEILGKKAIEVANATTFTAGEVVELQTQLSRLGFSIQQISDSTLAIAQTAQALGESVDVVAQKVGQVLKQFNIDASQTTEVTDTLVATVNNSALSFEGFGTAIQYVGPLAAQLGTTFAETAGAMAILADNGFTASRVGTGLRGILTSLGDEGQDLRSIISELADEHLSFAEAIDLVGKRNAAQLITLVDNIDKLEELDNEYEKSGAALSASAKQVDTFTGNMKLLNSAWDAFQIELGGFVANSGLVRSALRLISNESYQTAVALGVISGIDTDTLAKSIEESVDLYDKYRDDKFSIEESIRKASRETARNIIADTDEAVALQQALNGKAFADRMGNYQAIEIAQATLNNAQEDYNDLLEGTSVIFEEQIRQNKRLDIATEARTSTEAKYEETYKRLLEAQRDENLNFETAVKINKEIAETEQELRNIRNGALSEELEKLNSVERAGKQLTEGEIQRRIEIQNQLNAIDVYIAKISTLTIREEELTQLKKKQKKEADDIYKAELKRISEEIKNELDKLRRKKEDLDFQAAIAEKAGDTAAAEKARGEYLEYQAEVYGRLNKLVSDNAILTQESKDALNRMFSSLEIDEKEILQAFNSLVRVYSNSIKDATDEQLIDEEYRQGIVDQVVAGLASLAPQILEMTDEERGLLEKAVMNSIFGDDPDKAAQRIKKKTEEEAKATKKQLRDILGQLKDAFADSLGDFNQVAFDNLKSRLDAEKDAIKERYEFEEKILEAKFNNQLISESQYRAKQEQLRKEQIMAENALDKKEFDAEKKRDANQAKIDYLEAIASIFINEIKEGKGVITATQMQLIGSGIATLRFGAELAAINSRTFIPKKFEQGGLVQGPSHSNGGVPFSVQGQGGYEMEGGEFIVNKRATAMHYDLLSSINDRYAKGYSSSGMFANGGIVRTIEERKEELTLLREIASATTGTAVNTSKPARAFITSSDITNKETQQRINNRNTRL